MLATFLKSETRWTLRHSWPGEFKVRDCDFRLFPFYKGKSWDLAREATCLKPQRCQESDRGLQLWSLSSKGLWFHEAKPEWQWNGPIEEKIAWVTHDPQMQSLSSWAWIWKAKGTALPLRDFGISRKLGLRLWAALEASAQQPYGLDPEIHSSLTKLLSFSMH